MNTHHLVWVIIGLILALVVLIGLDRWAQARALARRRAAWSAIADKDRANLADRALRALVDPATTAKVAVDQPWLAEVLARHLHRGQTRRDQRTPYADHLADVARRVRAAGEGDLAVALAWLHDAVEDGHANVDGLTRAGVHPRVVAGAVMMARPKGQPYQAYVASLTGLARKVKPHDILSNLADDPTPRQVEKYGKALATLTDQ